MENNNVKLNKVITLLSCSNLIWNLNIELHLTNTDVLAYIYTKNIHFFMGKYSL